VIVPLAFDYEMAALAARVLDFFFALNLSTGQAESAIASSFDQPRRGEFDCSGVLALRRRDELIRLNRRR